MDREKLLNDLFEHVLTQMGYFPLPLPSRRTERIYHALFETAFHGDIFLSLFVTPAGAEMVLGQGNIPWEWQRKVWNSMKELPPLPPESTKWIQLLAIEDVPDAALLRFEHQMEQLQPFNLQDAQHDAEIRDGMSARGVVADEQHIHRFDIRTGDMLTYEQIQFFQVLIELGYASFAVSEHELLSAIQQYLPSHY